MTSVLKFAKRFLADQNGAALVEYTVLVGIIMVTIMAAILAIGTWVANKWTNLNTTLAG